MLSKVISQLEQELIKQGGLDKRWLLYDLNGELALADDHYLQAIDWYKKALNLYPKDRSKYLSRLGDTFLKFSKFSDAKKYFEYALQLNPNNILAELGRAKTFENLRQNENARNAYRNAIQIWSRADEQARLLKFAKRKISELN